MMKVATLIKTVIYSGVTTDQGSETVKQRLKDGALA